MKKASLFLCALVTFGSGSYAQDATFANANQSLLLLNPSFAGTNGFIRGQFMYGTQLPLKNTQPSTFYGGIDGYVKPLRAGIGLSFLHDDIGSGILKTDVAGLTYAQHISLLDDDLKIIPSLQVSVITRRLDRTKIGFGDYPDLPGSLVWGAPEAVPTQKKSNLDFSSGLLLNYKRFYFGTAVFHFNQPNMGLLGDFKLPYRFLLHSSYNFKTGERSLLNVMARYNLQQEKHYFQLNTNALLFKHLIVGAGCSFASHLKKYVNATIGIRDDFVNLSLGYNALVSGSNLQNGMWEAQLGITIRNKEHRNTLTNFEAW